MQPQLTTRLPIVLDTFLGLLRAAVSLNGVTVLDGPAANRGEVADDMIFVGPGNEDDPGAIVTSTPQSGLRASYIEQIEISMSVSSYSGDTDMKARRDRVNEMLVVIQDLVNANQVLADVWDQAGFGTDALWHPVQHSEGATCGVGFTIIFRSII